MTRSGSGYRFQARLPAALVVRSSNGANPTKPPTHLRVSTGPMSVREARAFGRRAAAVCQRIFDEGLARLAAECGRMERGRSMIDGKAGPTHPGMPNADAVIATKMSGADPVSIVEAAAEKLVADVARSSTQGFTDAQIAIMNEVAAAGATALRRMVERPDDVDAIMATLLRTGQGLDGVRHVMRLAPDDTSGAEASAHAMIGEFVGAFGCDANVRPAADRPLTAPAMYGAEPTGNEQPDVEPSDLDADGPRAMRFSTIADAYRADLDARPDKMSDKDRKRVGRMLDQFIEWAGDVTVAQCTKRMIIDYARDLHDLPSRAVFIKPLANATLPEMIAYGREHPSLSKIGQGTIKDSYVAFVRAAMKLHCDEHDIPDPFDGAKVAKPSAATKRSYRPLPMAVVNRAIVDGAGTSKLALGLLPTLGLLTTRRIAVLAYLHSDWLERVGDHWVCRPRAKVEIEGRTIDLRKKNDFSLLPFSIHQTLVNLGVVDHMQRHGFLFGPALRTRIPGAELSKRANRLLRGAGARGRAGGEVFHSLRSNGITLYRRYVPDLARNQSGHAPKDDHEGYDFGALTDREHVVRAATVPLPEGLDLSPLASFDLERARIVEDRMAKGSA